MNDTIIQAVSVIDLMFVCIHVVYTLGNDVLVYPDLLGYLYMQKVIRLHNF